MTAPTSSSAGKVRVSIENEIGWIVLDNPARLNSVSLSMWQALADAIERFETDSRVRCVVLRGEGAKAFCAGADISEFDKNRSEGEATAEYERVAHGAMNRLQRIDKPTVAMIAGYCIGGGVALALSCDLRVGAIGSRYGIPAAKLGLGYNHKSIRRLSSLIGPSKTKQIFFTAAHIQAEEAHRIGLIDELVKPDELEAFTRNLGASMACNAPLTMAAAKFAVELAIRETTPAEIEEAEKRELACNESEDFGEGRRAFMEKRRPVFTGR